MMHRFEVSEGGNELLLLIYPPRAILELAETLLAAERLYGPLPGSYTLDERWHGNFDEIHKAMPIGPPGDSCANAGTPKQKAKAFLRWRAKRESG